MKTYRALRHDIVRRKQALGLDEVHHPDEKINQIKSTLNHSSGLKILELFAGMGNLTKVYIEYGHVTALENNGEKYNRLIGIMSQYNGVEIVRKDSFKFIHGLISDNRKYDVVDLDPYGFPTRMFPHVFLLIEDGHLFVTMPKPYVNILNGITATHLISYFGEQNPCVDLIIERIVLWGLCHWRQVELISNIDCKSVWRMCFKVTKVKATDYTGVRNR